MLPTPPSAADSKESGTIKIKATFRDRIGIVADVSTMITRFGLNIVHMEVIRNQELTDVYVEIENTDSIHDKDFFIERFREINDFRRIERIETLPHEEKTNRFTVVLDNISDGVLSIDREGRITTINAVACKAFMKTPAEVVGKKLDSFAIPDYHLLQCLDGTKLNNVKQNLITPGGRYQYFSTCKPIYDAERRIIGAVEIAKDMQEIKKLAQSLSEDSRICFSDIIGRNSTIKEAIAFAEKIAATDISISIYGGSGTGKELFAKAIHSSSGRQGPFVPINCAALPENLLESELFGYVGGAFTGGRKEGKPGLFEIAENGTVFLDEIAEMPLVSQAKMLRLIQEKAVRRIGGAKEIPISARIVTATNKNLELLVQEKKFRQDLYYRISVLPIHIPPLKQRLGDIADLAEHFLFLLANRLGKAVPRMSPQALERLQGHEWPGNVRELKNVIERAAILCESEVIDEHYILFSHELNTFTTSPLERPVQLARPLKNQVIEFEKRIIQQTFADSKSVRRTASALQISHPALLKKMKKYGMKTVRTSTLG
ncbi:MAG TPA: Fis family transcriptional regulator [Desulfobulbaceae bacterium]|nr:Fis family transcriptional regulator [Desulfobulbaceae bacterium]